MKVYVEDFIILNASQYISSLLIIKNCLKFKTSYIKIFLASLLSGFFSIIYTFSASNIFIVIVCKISIPLFAISFCFKKLNIKKIVQSLSLMMLCSILLNGTFSERGEFLNGIMISSPNSLLSTLIIFILVSVIFKLSIELITRKKRIQENIVSIELFYKNKKIKKTAFLDSGNNLQFNNQPVNIINFKLFNQLTNISLNELLTKNFESKNFNYINCSTVTGKKKMLMLTLDKMIIFNHKKTDYIEKPKLALSLNFNNENYDIILNNLLI